MDLRLCLVVLCSLSTACGGTVTSPATDGGSETIVAGPPSSGGAYFQVQGGADPDAAGKFLSCPDGGRSVTLSVKGADGTDKLVVDGAGGAVAKCTVTASTFSIDVETAAGSFAASGTYTTTATTMVSTDAAVTLAFPGASYKTGSTKCTIDFDPTQSTGGKLYGKVTCTKLAHTSIATDACAISAINGSFFRFANCK